MARNYDDWIAGYLKYTEHLESPEKIHQWVAVGTIAAALRRKVWIGQGFFNWIPNFYIIICGPAGVVRKSTSIAQGEALLKKVPGIRLAPNCSTTEAMIQLVGAEVDGFDNVEGLMPDGSAGMLETCSLTVAASELGSFLKPKDPTQIDILTDLWDGKITPGVWSKSTKTQGSDDLPNPWINVMACTTPTWIADNFTRQLLASGFVSRCIFVYSEEPRARNAYLSRILRDLKINIFEHYTALLEDLKRIAAIKGVYTMTEEAMDYGEVWYEEIMDQLQLVKHHDRKAAQLSRKQTMAHKLAIVMAASRRDERIIELEDLQRAITWVQAVEQDSNEALRLSETTDENRGLATLTRVLATNGGLEKGMLFRHVSDTLPWAQFEIALNSGMKTGVLESISTDKKVKIKLAG